MKFGDVVIYEEGGKKYNAVVLGFRDLADHMGTNNEPLLNIAFAREVLDMYSKPQNLAGTGSWSKLLQNRVDVAHKSHEYSDDAKKKYGNRFEGGRWSEAVTTVQTVKPIEAAKPIELAKPAPPADAKPTVANPVPPKVN